MMEYAILIVKLSEDDGGGYLAIVPDLYGCMADGETHEEALANAKAAISDWLEVCQELGRPTPEVGNAAKKARNREKALIETIHVLSEKFDGLDGRIDQLSAQIEHLTEVIENQDAWSRFEKIANFEARPLESNTLPC